MLLYIRNSTQRFYPNFSSENSTVRNKTLLFSVVCGTAAKSLNHKSHLFFFFMQNYVINSFRVLNTLPRYKYQINVFHYINLTLSFLKHFLHVKYIFLSLTVTELHVLKYQFFFLLTSYISHTSTTRHSTH